jgi:hypothetical protein
MLMNYPASLSLLLSASLLSACGDDSTTGAGGDTGGTSTSAGGTTTVGGSASVGGAGGSGGAGTGGEGVGGFAFGMPIDAPENEWTWVDFPDSRCMNDTPTGIGINKSSASDKVVIFLMGGNACFNQASCFITANKDGYGAQKFASEGALNSALFSRTAENPLKDHSYVFVPYCSGDVHAGNNDGVMIGNTTYKFKGHVNIKHYLERLVPTFPNASQIVLTGVSAGGFGAAYSLDLVSRGFEGKPVVLIDDSGPPMGSTFVAPCLQKRFIETWGIASTLPPACPSCVDADGSFIENYVNHVKTAYPTHRFGLVSSAEDQTIRQFWSFGENNCASIDGFPGNYSGAKYTEGLEDIRDRMMAGNDNFALFMAPGSKHVLLDGDPAALTVGGTSLLTWLTQAVTNDPAWTSTP